MPEVNLVMMMGGKQQNESAHSLARDGYRIPPQGLTGAHLGFREMERPARANPDPEDFLAALEVDAGRGVPETRQSRGTRRANPDYYGSAASRPDITTPKERPT